MFLAQCHARMYKRIYSRLLPACSPLCAIVCRASRAEAVSKFVEGPDSESSELSSELCHTQSQAATLASSCGTISFHTSERHTPGLGPDLAFPAGQHV